jgi:hypothetical protein
MALEHFSAAHGHETVSVYLIFIKQPVQHISVHGYQ